MHKIPPLDFPRLRDSVRRIEMGCKRADFPLLFPPAENGGHPREWGLTQGIRPYALRHHADSGLTWVAGEVRAAVRLPSFSRQNGTRRRGYLTLFRKGHQVYIPQLPSHWSLRPQHSHLPQSIPTSEVRVSVDVTTVSHVAGVGGWQRWLRRCLGGARCWQPRVLLVVRL